MKIEKFVKLMTGHFDNKEQFTAMKEAGKIYPYAQHVNTVCNDKVKNIPVRWPSGPHCRFWPHRAAGCCGCAGRASVPDWNRPSKPGRC